MTSPALSRRRLLEAAGAVALVGGEPVAAATRAPNDGAAWDRSRASRSGLDLAGIDRKVRPGDDFFRFANGAWYDRHQFAADEVQAGGRATMGDLRRARVQALVETAAANRNGGALEHQIGRLYASFIDVSSRDAAGLTPLAPDLAAIARVRDAESLARLLGEAPVRGLASPFELSVFYDFHEPGRVRFTLSPGGLGLPSREHYLEARYAPDVQAYGAYVSDILTVAGLDPGAARAVVAFETELAKLYWPTPEAQNFVKTANNLTPAQLAALAPEFPWDTFLGAAGAKDTQIVIVRQPPVTGPLAKLILETPWTTWRAYLTFHLLSNNAEFLTRALDAKRFEFYGVRLSGQQAQRPLAARGADLIEGLLPQQVGRLYVERFVDPRTKPLIAEIFGHVREVMRLRIESATWMSASTRQEAFRKIQTLKVKLVYPEVWPPAADLSFAEGDFYGNLRLARAAAARLRAERTRAPLDPREWQTSPQNTSAAANPAANEITAPAGSLVPPYFKPSAAPAVNYGAVGGVLGHELSHMFDQVGRRLDADGRLRDWWEPEDAERYEAMAERVVRQYEGFEPLPGHRVNGRQTLNENIADINGLGLAHAAFHRAFPLAGRPVDGFTADQMFFLGWAQMRRGKMRDQALISQLATGVHSPDMYRVNGVVRNLDAWYAAFGVKSDAALYLPPNERARFW